MTKNVLNFKLEYGEEEITPYAGMGMYEEMYRAIGLDKEIGNTFPKPGSGKGLEANEYIMPIVIMFLGDRPRISFDSTEVEESADEIV
jgi:hypothetical protein